MAESRDGRHADTALASPASSRPVAREMFDYTASQLDTPHQGRDHDAGNPPGARPMDVVVWLRSLGLGKYEAVFRENEIDETVLPNLTGGGPQGAWRRSCWSSPNTSHSF